MSGLRLVTGLSGAIFLLVVGEFLRRRQLREKYAVLWLTTGLLMLPFAVYPPIFDGLAEGLGIADPPNLLLFLAVVFLLFVCMHLSWEVSKLEAETRVLAEEIALSRLDQSSLRDE